MNDRKQRIDEFLKYLRDISKQNPNYELSKNNIYSLLTGLGISKNEDHKGISHNFSKWISHFENDHRCDVFVSPDWRYFCQFISSDKSANNLAEHLKVYIPLDSSHIEKGAIEIFEFLSKQGISHFSEIGSQVCFNDIVVRLVNPADLEKLLNFINNNRYIQEGLLLANPFTFNKNGVAMAVEGSLSYNLTIATMIRLYINNKRCDNNLNTVSVDDFYMFAENYYNNAFDTAFGIEKLEKDFNDGKKLSINLIVNYKNIMKLLLKSIRNGFDFNDYIAHFRECSNKEIQEAKVNEIIANKNEENSKYDEELEERVNLGIKEIIQVMTCKYDYETALRYLQIYINTGNPNFLTRDSKLRERIEYSSFREDAIKVLQKRQVSLLNYLNSITNVDTNNRIYKELEERVNLGIKEIIQVMTYKYGYETALHHLQDYIDTGNPNFLTRDYMLRERIEDSLFREDAIKVLQKRQVSLPDYLKKVLNISVNDMNATLNDTKERRI